MTVRLHIDRVVVDAGLGVARADARLLERAIVAELGLLLGAIEGGWTAGAMPLVRLDSRAAGVADAGTLGARIAGALNDGIAP
jgi:hypothetical protein